MVDPRVAHFPAEARTRFAFLVERFGFRGPDDGEAGFVGYADPPIWIWIGLDERNRTVDTVLRFDDGDVAGTVPLSLLVEEVTGRGFHFSPGSAQTRQGMTASLRRQAKTLRGLMPFVQSPEGRRLIRHIVRREHE